MHFRAWHLYLCHAIPIEQLELLSKAFLLGHLVGVWGCLWCDKSSRCLVKLGGRSRTWTSAQVRHSSCGQTPATATPLLFTGTQSHCLCLHLDEEGLFSTLSLDTNSITLKAWWKALKSNQLANECTSAASFRNGASARSTAKQLLPRHNDAYLK